MSSIRIENKDIYKIEVNDNGDCIELNIKDIGLAVRCYESIDMITKISEKAQNDIKELVGVEDADKKITEIEKQLFIDMRKAIDYFLGENACQKIYGDVNYYDMFNDLLDELSKKRPELNNKSHLDMMGIKAESIGDKIREKYQKEQNKVL